MTVLTSSTALSLLLMLSATTSVAYADDDACTHFKWDVTHERAMMAQTPTRVAAATKVTTPPPLLQVGKNYLIALAPQADVAFAFAPGKPIHVDDAHAGLLRLHVAAAGRYRFALSTPHWIDVIDNTHIIASADFNGVHGCERPRKIVEYDLDANRDVVVQLSGASDASIDLAVVAAAKTTP